MKQNTALIFFAKYPRIGHVKTRLTQGESLLSANQATDLYRSFLADYILRLKKLKIDASIFFCTRPSPDFILFQNETVGSNFPVVEEPFFRGIPAKNIGEAMSYTIRHFLEQGFCKVIIMGSDLPHFPKKAITEAIDLLEYHLLVLGDDGWGCYLVGASEAPIIFEECDIPWSQGKDFSAIVDLQLSRSKKVGILLFKARDIDSPEDLQWLIEALESQKISRSLIPSTSSLLEFWGMLSHDSPS